MKVRNILMLIGPSRRWSWNAVTLIFWRPLQGKSAWHRADVAFRSTVRNGAVV